MTGYTATLGLAKPDFNSVGWDDQLNANFDAIDAAVAQSIFFQGFRGQWLNNTLYAVDDIAIDTATNETFKCLVQHTSANSPTTFAATRVANPTYWEEVDTAAASAAAAQAHAANAETAKNNAASYATSANTSANLALTYGTNASSSATTAYNAASVASAAASLAQAAVYNLRAVATLTPTASANTDISFQCPAGYITKIMVYTKTAFTGATVALRVGTTSGGDELVASTTIKDQDIYTFTIKPSAAPLIAPYGGGTIYARIEQTTPTAVGAAKILVELSPQEA